MDPLTAFLLSMEATGLITSFFGAHSRQKTIEMGRALEQEQFSTNLQALRLESSEASLQEMKQVRQNIGAQIVANAARGNRGGSSYLGIQESTHNFQEDERTRRLNLLAKESQLRSSNILSGLHTLDVETELGQNMFNNFLNTVPISSGLDKLFSYTRKKNNNATGNSGGNFNWGY